MCDSAHNFDRGRNVECLDAKKSSFFTVCGEPGFAKGTFSQGCLQPVFSQSALVKGSGKSCLILVGMREERVI